MGFLVIALVMQVEHLEGIRVIDFEKFVDIRGSFYRVFDKIQFDDKQASFDIVQISISENDSLGTVRGLHMLSTEYGEGKVITCLNGEILDVVVDMRPWSTTFTSHMKVPLSKMEAKALYIPPGFAHGFQTLANKSDVLYCMSKPYDPQLEIGFRFNDPKLDINWPLEVKTISDKDSLWPLL